MSSVSVIIPAYNAEKFIDEALESVFCQTYTDIEVVVIDDGSTDRTALILERYKDRIRYVFQHNKGLAAARNAGIRISSGSYIAFLDADDFFLPMKVEVQKKYLDIHTDIDMVFSDFEYMGGSVLRHPVPKSFTRQTGNQFLDLFKFNCIAVPTVLLRKKIFDEIGYFDERLQAAEDYDLWLRFSKKKKIGYIDSVCARVRLHAENMSRDAERMCEAELKVVDKVLHEDPGFSEQHSLLISIKKSLIYFESGYRFFLSGEMKKARSKFLSALKQRPVWPKPYLYFIVSYMGRRGTDSIRALKRSFHPRR